MVTNTFCSGFLSIEKHYKTVQQEMVIQGRLMETLSAASVVDFSAWYFFPDKKIISYMTAAADPGLPREGGRQPIILSNFPKICMKMKKT